MKNLTELNKKGSMKKKRSRSWVLNIIMGIAILVFVISGYELYKIYSEYQEGGNEYEHVTEEVVSVAETPEEPDEPEQEETKERMDPRTFLVDFEKLLKINGDAVAWIRFDEPERISYPVVHTTDNDTYLTKTFEGKGNKVGALFVDMNNTSTFEDQNTFIYGHNMKDGSMFGQLRKYKKKSFYEKNPYFYIYTPDGNVSTYQIFCVEIVEDTSESFTKYFADTAEFVAYIEMVRENALYDTGVSVPATGKTITLSTCTNVKETERLLVHGVKIGEEKTEKTE